MSSGIVGFFEIQCMTDAKDLCKGSGAGRTEGRQNSPGLMPQAVFFSLFSEIRLL